MAREPNRIKDIAVLSHPTYGGRFIERHIHRTAPIDFKRLSAEHGENTAQFHKQACIMSVRGLRLANTIVKDVINWTAANVYAVVSRQPKIKHLLTVVIEWEPASPSKRR